jgi:4-hydroxybenzoate polyprenyltransferase
MSDPKAPSELLSSRVVTSDYPVRGRTRLRVYLRLGRVSNLPTVWTNVLAGAMLSGADAAVGRLATVVVALSLFYVAGMYLNDAFDRHVDARERPERPIPSGLISATAVFTIGSGLLAAAIIILVVNGMIAGSRLTPTVISGLALAGVIIYYDVRHKRDPMSPLVMGLCRVLVYVTAALAIADRLTSPVLGGAVILLSYLIGLTYVAKQETLTEYRNLWPLAFLFAPFVYTAPGLLHSSVATVIYLGFLIWVGYGVMLLVRRGRVNIPRAVISFIAGISLLDALLIANSGATSVAPWGIAGFGATLLLQRYVRGT